MQYRWTHCDFPSWGILPDKNYISRCSRIIPSAQAHILHCIYERGKELGASGNDLKSKHIEQGNLRSWLKASPSSSTRPECSPAHSRVFGHSPLCWVAVFASNTTSSILKMPKNPVWCQGSAMGMLVTKFCCNDLGACWVFLSSPFSHLALLAGIKVNCFHFLLFPLIF